MPQQATQHSEKPTRRENLTGKDLNRTDNLTRTDDDIKTQRAITIEDHTPEDVFDFWRNFHNLSYFMKGITSIEVLSPIKSRWTAKSKSGLELQWEAAITEEVPGRLIAWKSLPGSSVKIEGTVHFSAENHSEDEPRAVVRLSMNYELPGGQLTEFATSLMAEDPDTLVQVNLRRLKAYLETGEVPTTEGQSSGEHEEDTIKH